MVQFIILCVYLKIWQPLTFTGTSNYHRIYNLMQTSLKTLCFGRRNNESQERDGILGIKCANKTLLFGSHRSVSRLCPACSFSPRSLLCIPPYYTDTCLMLPMALKMHSLNHFREALCSLQTAVWWIHQQLLSFASAISEAATLEVLSRCQAPGR